MSIASVPVIVIIFVVAIMPTAIIPMIKILFFVLVAMTTTIMAMAEMRFMEAIESMTIMPIVTMIVVVIRRGSTARLLEVGLKTMLFVMNRSLLMAVMKAAGSSLAERV